MVNNLIDSVYCLSVMVLSLQLWSDFVYGSCVDALVKSQAGDCEPGDQGCPKVYMYLFTHRSEFEPLPFWMGKNFTVVCIITLCNNAFLFNSGLLQHCGAFCVVFYFDLCLQLLFNNNNNNNIVISDWKHVFKQTKNKVKNYLLPLEECSDGTTFCP